MRKVDYRTLFAEARTGPGAPVSARPDWDGRTFSLDGDDGDDDGDGDGGGDDDDDDDGGDDDDADDGGGGGDDDVEARDGPGAPVSSAAQLGRHWQDIQPSQKDSEKFNIVKYLFHQLQRASAPIGMIFAKKKSPFHLNYLGTIQPTRVPKEHLVTLFTKKNKSERESKPIWLRIRDQQECTTTK